MTPFSTDSVSLGRPAICGAPGTRPSQGSHISRVSWGISYSQLCAWLSLPSYYIPFKVHKCAQASARRIPYSLLLLG